MALKKKKTHDRLRGRLGLLAMINRPSSSAVKALIDKRILARSIRDLSYC